MKRDPRLRDLSDDHHQALVLARRATRATAGDHAASLRVWKEIVHRFDRELAPHFAIEEQYLLPAVERNGAADLAKRTRDEHAELRRLIADDLLDAQHRLERFGTLLREHVRFEERVLFAVIQETLGDGVLDSVADACRERKIDRRPTDRTTPP